MISDTRLTDATMRFVADPSLPSAAFSHYWETCVGSCHAAMALRQDWREQLACCHRELGFRYVRFHGLFDQDMGIYGVWRDHPVEYSFHNVDSIVDFLLSIGMKPFVELSFMPDDMASGSTTVFHYKANVTPPRDYAAWSTLVETLVRHLVARYGVDEVRTWFFEVWNEPNLACFWTGTQRDYFTLYGAAAKAVKSVDPQIPVGGPATCKNAWIPEFLQFCRTEGVAVDFVSTHHYPTDAALGHDLDMESQMAVAGRGVLTSMARQARKEAGPLPLFYTEWSNSPSSRDPYHDRPFAAAFIAKTILDNHGTADIYSYWTFSDIFEECRLSSIPFHGGFGLLNIHGIPKPSYRAFEMLHRLGDQRIPVKYPLDAGTINVACLVAPEGLQLLVSNHHMPKNPIAREDVVVTVKGCPMVTDAWVERIDEDHANAPRTWENLGRPMYPGRSAIDAMHASSLVVREKMAWNAVGGDVTVRLTMPPHSVALVTMPMQRNNHDATSPAG